MTLQAELENFYGTQYYHRLTLTKIVCTDGVKFFAEKGEAFWCVDDMSIMAIKLNQPFLAITVTAKNSKAKIVYTDGNNNILKTKRYGYTTLADGEYNFYCTDDVLMLSSEY